MGSVSRADLGMALRAARLAAKESQALAAGFAGVTQAALSNYENGKRDTPISVVIGLADRYTDGDVNKLIAPAISRKG